MKHLLYIDDLTKDDINTIFSRVPGMERGFFNHSGDPIAPNSDAIMATLFFEPSTRTKLSFHTAMYRLGGKVIDLPMDSSQKKGETDIDTIKTVAEYADVLVIRHPQPIMAQLAAASNKPVISAGESSLHHPTQALLDLYTIRKYCKDRRSITVMFTGDLYYSRTVPALVHLLRQEPYHVNFIFTSKVNPAIMIRNHVAFSYTDERVIPNVLKSVDVLYMTRPQKERWEDGEVGSSFVLTKELAQTMRSDSLIMHPLPRNEEIHPDVDELPHAKYFEQVHNGVYVRMALLHCLFWK